MKNINLKENATRLDALLSHLCRMGGGINAKQYDMRDMMKLKSIGLISIEEDSSDYICKVLEKGYSYNKEGGFVGEINRKKELERKEKRERNSDITARAIGITALMLSLLSLIFSLL